MLSYDIRSLESQAAHVHGRLAPDDLVWEEGDVLPAGPIQVEGRLSAAGPSRFYYSGRFEGETVLPCRRCLKEVTSPVEEEAHFIFSSEGDDSTDDPDVYPFDPNSNNLDLRPAVREVWLLAVPAFVQCREDCKGLCPSCGIDLNEETCDCTPVAIDTRWDALRAIRDELP
ncbi:MAG TPA: DUF177 domain-containing protein [Gemmatimonadaceae bacterium]|nr:DUF177 domain-containing protein [Gemmatimonadaceae bacterium]